VPSVQDSRDVSVQNTLFQYKILSQQGYMSVLTIPSVGCSSTKHVSRDMSVLTIPSVGYASTNYVSRDIPVQNIQSGGIFQYRIFSQ
jgi:hypothetical protein